MIHSRCAGLANKPMKLSVPPQGHCSIIEVPVRAAGPQLIGKAFDRRSWLADCLT